MTTHTAHYVREGDAWVVTFDHPDISTFAPTYDAARHSAREALAVTLGYDSVDELERTVTVVDHVADASRA